MESNFRTTASSACTAESVRLTDFREEFHANALVTFDENGVNILPNKERCIASFEKADVHGKTTFIIQSGYCCGRLPDGHYYAGTFENGLPNGTGSLVKEGPDGYLIEGTFENGEPHGMCKKSYPPRKNRVYREAIGTFNCGSLEGTGAERWIIAFSNPRGAPKGPRETVEIIFNGEYNNGHRNGEGALFWNGAKFEAQCYSDWFEGRRRGACRSIFQRTQGGSNKLGAGGLEGGLTSTEGTRLSSHISGKLEAIGSWEYEGSIVESEDCVELLSGVHDWNTWRRTLTGHGTLSTAEDVCYEGDFVHGRPIGPFRKISADGAVYEGELDSAEMEPVGEGRMQFPDGRLYTGTFRNGTMHGWGTMQFAEGTEIKAEWNYGVAVLPAVQVCRDVCTSRPESSSPARCEKLGGGRGGR
eukprot:GHVU01186633.1.p1 GENE.GHVU01186633.1~~GHVU01186633.1.p1  ORF type:complete len:415 (+),score=42.20 GHVU01186633.1:90-1334(+)